MTEFVNMLVHSLRELQFQRLCIFGLYGTIQMLLLVLACYKILLTDTPCLADTKHAWHEYIRATRSLYRAILIGKLCYASNAWWGFASADDRQHMAIVPSI